MYFYAINTPPIWGVRTSHANSSFLLLSYSITINMNPFNFLSLFLSFSLLIPLATSSTTPTLLFQVRIYHLPMFSIYVRSIHLAKLDTYVHLFRTYVTHCTKASKCFSISIFLVCWFEVRNAL